MWLLKFLPTWFVHLIWLSGAAAFIAAVFFKHLPVVRAYTIPVKLMGAVLMVLGFYLAGALANEKAWQAKVKELEAKVEVAEEKAKHVNTVVDTKIVTQTKVIKEKGQEIIKYIDRDVVKKEEVIKFIENCPIPKDIVDLHNAATELNKATNK